MENLFFFFICICIWLVLPSMRSRADAVTGSGRIRIRCGEDRILEKLSPVARAYHVGISMALDDGMSTYGAEFCDTGNRGQVVSVCLVEGPHLLCTDYLFAFAQRKGICYKHGKEGELALNTILVSSDVSGMALAGLAAPPSLEEFTCDELGRFIDESDIDMCKDEMLPELCICALLLPLLAVTLSCRAQNVDFSFPTFNNRSEDILLDGNCSVTAAFLRLSVNNSDVWENPAPNLVSRAVYKNPVQFYDVGTGAEASFTLSFNFKITPVAPGVEMGGGMAFIIANTRMVPSAGSAGAGLGLYDNSSLDFARDPADSTNQVLAVEFDFAYDVGVDPVNDSNHVGLDINSVKSNMTRSLSGLGIDPVHTNTSGGSWSVCIVYSAHVLDVYMTSQDERTSRTSMGGCPKPNDSSPVLRAPVNVSSIVEPYSYVGFTASTGDNIQETQVYNWNFSTRGLGLPQPLPPASSPAAAWIATGATLLVIALGCCVFWFCYGRSGGSSGKNGLALMMLHKASTSSKGRISGPSRMSSLEDADMKYGTRRLIFTYQELKKATQGFSQSQILGKGGFGTVYLGVIQIGGSQRELAIKRISQDSRQGEREFLAELQSLGQLRHRNLVHLQGWCHEGDELLLVYEYMPNLSLDRHLYSSQQVLSWTERFHVVRGIAAALVHIHTEWKKCILHRDIKPSNVMLDSNMDGRLGDFGLSRLVEESINSGITLTGFAGTQGYMAPELALSGKVTTKSDVFSFGVLSLEVVCGRKPQNPNHEIQLLEWVWQMQEAGTLLDVVDPALDGKFDAGQLTCMLHVGLRCTHPDPNFRPSTRHVQQMLNGDVELPSLPRSRPVAVYGVDLGDTP